MGDTETYGLQSSRVLRQSTDGQRCGPAVDWAALNPILLRGELGYEEDTGVLKVGDGATRWASLRSASGGISAPAVAGVVSALQRGTRSVCMQNTGDSTGDASNEWFGLLGSTLAAKYPAYGVLWRGWNDSTQTYDPPTTLVAPPAGARYVDLDGTVGFRSTGPNVTGDLEVQAKVQMASWTGSTDCFAAKYDTSGNQRSWYFWLNGSGNLVLTWSADGTATTTATSTAGVGLATGAPGWVRVTHDVDNGASGNDVKFYTSTDGSTWTQLGSTVTTAGTTSHFASSADWTLGLRNPSSPLDVLQGRLYEVRCLSGFGSGAYDVMPVLPEHWDQSSGFGSASYVYGGSPVLYLYAGSQSGQGVSYFDNSTRRPKLFATLGQRVLFVNTAMNDGGSWTQFALSTYQTWLGNVRGLLPGVPFVCLGQNPVGVGALIPSQNHVDIRYERNAALLTWAASGAVSGTYPVDIFPAFPSAFAGYLADGYLHPSAGAAGGSGLIAAYLLRGLFACSGI